MVRHDGSLIVGDQRAVKSAVDSAKFSAETKEAVIASPQVPSGDFAERVGRSFSEISDDDKIDLALSLESAAIASDSRISRVRSPKYEEVTSSVFIRIRTASPPAEGVRWRI